MTGLRRLLVAAAFAVVVLGGRTAHAQALGRVDVDKARAAYLARNYAEAEQRLMQLVDPKTGLKELALLSQARMFLGAVLIAQGRPAVETFETLILEDPSFEPDPLQFPGSVINEFYDIRGRLQQRIRQNALEAARREAARIAAAEEERRKQEAWLATVKQMAQEEKITVKNHRLVAFLPFGAGQFQNGEPLLGWTFLVSEAALVVATAATIPMYTYARGRADDEQSGGDINRTAQLYQDRADNIRTANLAFAGALAAIAITGVVQANLAYVPEKVETKKRDLPVVSRLQVKPVLSPVFVGITSTF
jgi:hypothetical protein